MRRLWHWLMHFIGWNVGEVCLAALKAHGVEEGTNVPEPESAATGGTE